MMNPNVTIVLLNWNSYDDVSKCINHLQNIEYNNKDILLVDNGSTDGSGERLKKEYEEVKMIQNEDNLGFGAGNNVGIQIALDQGADYVLLINNDVIICNDILDRMVSDMEENPNIGIMTPQIMEFPDTETVWFKKGGINRRIGSYYHDSNKKWYIHGFSNQPTVAGSNKDSKLINNEYLPFACALFRSEVFKKVGLLPEEYFLYTEDVEYCIQVLSSGYDIVTNAQLVVYHKKSPDSSLSPIRSYYGVRNRHIFVHRHKKETNLYLFYIHYIFWVFLLIGQRLLSRNTPSALAVIRGFVDGLRFNMGKGPYP